MSLYPPGVRVWCYKHREPGTFVIKIVGPAGEDHRDAVEAVLQSMNASLTRVEPTPADAAAGRFVLLARVI